MTLGRATGWAALILSLFLAGWLVRPALDAIRVETIRVYPAPWRVPATPGAGTLRLAMVHDALTGRFPVRSQAFHESRAASMAARVAAWDGGTDLEALADIDDLAVSLDRLGRPAEGIPLLRRKAEALALPWPPPPRSATVASERGDLEAVRLRPPLDARAKAVYATWANLGTLLVHAHLPAALAGDPAALAQVDDGLACLRAAVAVDPAAHFGRERWQITVVEHLRACTRDPGLLRRFNAIGMALDGSKVRNETDALENDRHRPDDIRQEWRSLMPVDRRRSAEDYRFWERFTEADWDRFIESDPEATDLRLRLRSAMPRVGIHPEWLAAVDPTWTHRARFDEPLLGMVGLWVLGGGEHPHLALVIAGICEQVGQPELAIAAYGAVDRLADRYSPDPATRTWIRAHAAARRMAMAETLLTGDDTPEARMALLAAGDARIAEQRAWALRQREAGDAGLASDPGAADEVWTREKPEIPMLLKLVTLLFWITAGTIWIRLMLLWLFRPTPP
jgi:hypothetical protein